MDIESYPVKVIQSTFNINQFIGIHDKMPTYCGIVINTVLRGCKFYHRSRIVPPNRLLDYNCVYQFHRRVHRDQFLHTSPNGQQPTPYKEQNCWHQNIVTHLEIKMEPGLSTKF